MSPPLPHDVSGLPATSRRAVLLASALVLLVYGLISLLLADGGSQGADTGAKVATLEVMRIRDTWRPEVGYWASEWDPEAQVHGLQQTVPVGDDFVAVSTLPMLLLGHPLYDLGGYDLALLLPMLGGLACAWGCRALARRLGDEHLGWVTFWVMALASPLVLYSVDFWEHAPGAALMVWGAVHLLDVALGVERRWSPVVAGLLFGAAATMRSEALVAVFVATSAACLATLIGDRVIRRTFLAGSGVMLGFGSTWGANVVLERLVLDGGGGDRTSRTAGLARSAGLQIVDRLHEGVLSVLSTHATWSLSAALMGAAGVTLLIIAVHRAAAGEMLFALICSIGSFALVLLPFVDGLGWVPGAWVALPSAGAGLLALTRPGPLRWTAVACLVAYPITWAVQYLDAVQLQWGGRYALAVTLVLGTCGVCAVGRISKRALPYVIAPGVAVTLLGVSWLTYRTHEIESLFDKLVERPEEVVIFASYGAFAREGMDAYVERRWLAESGSGDLDDAVEVADAAGLASIAVVDFRLDLEPEDRLGPFELESKTTYEFTGFQLNLASYARRG